MRNCKMCGKEILWNKRWHTETCSGACRKAWSRRKERVGRCKSNIMSELQELRLMLKKYPDLADPINADLRYFQEEISDLLRLRPDEAERQLIEMQYDLARKRG